MRTGYEIREGSAEIAARVLRDPANWPSLTKDSRLLEHRIRFGKRLLVTRAGMHTWLEAA